MVQGLLQYCNHFSAWSLLNWLVPDISMIGYIWCLSKHGMQSARMSTKPMSNIWVWIEIWDLGGQIHFFFWTKHTSVVLKFDPYPTRIDVDWSCGSHNNAGKQFELLLRSTAWRNKNRKYSGVQRLFFFSGCSGGNLTYQQHPNKPPCFFPGECWSSMGVYLWESKTSTAQVAVRDCK